MEIKRRAVAGTLESSDVFVDISPSGDGISIRIESVVSNQFGTQIETAVADTLRQFQVDHAIVLLNDRGALDCTIRARVETAIRRAGKEVG